MLGTGRAIINCVGCATNTSQVPQLLLLHDTTALHHAIQNSKTSLRREQAKEKRTPAPITWLYMHAATQICTDGYIDSERNIRRKQTAPERDGHLLVKSRRRPSAPPLPSFLPSCVSGSIRWQTTAPPTTAAAVSPRLSPLPLPQRRRRAARPASPPWTERQQP